MVVVLKLYAGSFGHNQRIIGKKKNVVPSHRSYWGQPDGASSTRWFWRAIGRWSKTGSSSWATKSQSSRTEELVTKDRFIWALKTTRLHSFTFRTESMWFRRFSRGTFIRWLIRVIALELQLTLLLKPEESDQLLIPRHTVTFHG